VRSKKPPKFSERLLLAAFRSTNSPRSIFASTRRAQASAWAFFRVEGAILLGSAKASNFYWPLVAALPDCCHLQTLIVIMFCLG
jgi:hypothetical protein